MAQEDQYECHDIYLAAYLSEAGCELKGRRRQGHRVFFQFTNAAGPIESLREDFYSGRGKVTASKYADSVKKFKELCHIDS